jgi:hypothetical protein
LSRVFGAGFESVKAALFSSAIRIVEVMASSSIESVLEIDVFSP